MADTAIEFRNIAKSFGPVKANHNISFAVPRGSIHAIVGENGAGKSTAMKILFGLYQPDEGQFFIRGKEVQFDSPMDAMAEGVGMVHQHFMLAGSLTALDNILLMQKGRAFEKLPRKEQKHKLEEIAQRYGMMLNLETKVDDLSVGEQQRLEILKILSQNSEIIILDEPTAVLTPQEVQDLFKNLRLLKDEGKTILIITHKLKEVIAISDNVTVFRAGTVVANRKTSEVQSDSLAELMVGRHLQKNQERKTKIDQDKVLLSLKNVSANIGNRKLQNVNLQIRAQEIVGVAGVEGNGQDVLMRVLLDRPSLKKGCWSGDIRQNGSLESFPEDRLRFGVLPSKTAVENFILGHHRRTPFYSRGFISDSAAVVETEKAMKEFDVRPLQPRQIFSQFSGGNQQKLVVARALWPNPDIVIAAQPTRGVDIGAIEFIHGKLRAQRDQGSGILLISSELDELMTLADRIVVIYHGEFIKEFTRAEFNEVALGAAMGGCR